MRNKGWIRLDRKIEDHWLWEDKPFSKGQAWIDLLLLANHEDKIFVLGNQTVAVTPGEIITSELKLMSYWGWSKSKVRAFLTLLEKDNMITKKTDNKKTVINIVNWGSYQIQQTANITTNDTADDTANDTTAEPQRDHNETSKRPQKDTNNNYNNYKQLLTTTNNYKQDNNKGYVRKRFAPPTIEQIETYCMDRGNNVDAQRFFDYYEARGWKLKGGSPMKDWKAAVRTWENTDYSRQDIGYQRTRTWENNQGDYFMRVAKGEA